MNERSWTLDEALNFIRNLSRVLLPHGWGVGLCGSVLTKGSSHKDLDIIIFPRDTTSMSYSKLIELLEGTGLTLKHNHMVVQEAWRKAGSRDNKIVEVWRTANGKRVDIFLLR
jgi:hypothetical protein